MKDLPPKARRSLNRSFRWKCGSPGDHKKYGVQPPQILVKLANKDWYTKRYAPAKIRVRNGCYRYLVWRDGLEKREFYLGKVKILTPLVLEAAGDVDGRCRRAAGAEAGGKK